MNKFVPIHALSEQMGLTSRTLRHWEAEGLFKSVRDANSGWRVYDDQAVLCIRITAMLRAFGIPIKEIKAVMEERTDTQLYNVIENKIASLQAQRAENLFQEKQLTQALALLQKQGAEWMTNLNKPWNEMEDCSMNDVMLEEHYANLKFITLPPMRTAYHIAVGVSPEDEAIAPVVNWIKSSNLMGTVRLFGGNVQPLPSGSGKPYGYEMCATIPDSVTVPGHLQEMTLPGGLYALLESTDDIGGSWKALMNALSAHGKYRSDRARLCLEEHIRNDNPEGSGNEYFLHLLEPVKAK